VADKKRPGRPSKFKPEFCKQAVGLTKLGATDREVAEFFEVSEVTLNTWKHQHPEFLKSLKQGKESADNRVEQSLYRRALGYSHDEVHISNYMGEVTQTPIVKHYAPDTTACIFWLKNRKPAEWRDRIEHSGDVTGTVKHELTDRETARWAAFFLSKGLRDKP
jgi:transposase-like protein